MATLKSRNPFDGNFFDSVQSSKGDTDVPHDGDIVKKPGQRLNIEVDPNLHKALKRRAVEEERTISDILRQLIETYLGL
jgi:Ribbon-helix-helix protein, copG family